MKKINGHDLINMGYTPGKWFGEALTHINANNLSHDEIIAYMEAHKPAPKILPHEAPVVYYKNIVAETEDEKTNVESVFATMNVLMTTPTVVAGAVMPDACPTGSVGQIPVGGIMVALNAIHPGSHSPDICCSLYCTSFPVDTDLKLILDEAHNVTHFGGGGRSEFSVLPEELKEKILSNRYLKDALHLAEAHLGTQGDGNHFLYVGVKESTGEPTVVTHHGSRAFGAFLYKRGMAIAEKFRKELSPKTLEKNAWIPYNTEEGQAYWDALQIVREWTKLNHATIHNAVAEKLGVTPTLTFWNEHNFVFKDGDKFYHAKGATPLDDKFVPDSYNGLRLIPLNMAQPILIVRGETTETNLGFAPHGAGRNLSRSEHSRRKGDKSIEQIFVEETKGLDVRFFSGNPDISELPSAYKNAENVQKQIEQFGLGTVVDKINPYGCIMAGDWKKDAPWRKNK
jgi:tRNA-splicing ligase RtcB